MRAWYYRKLMKFFEHRRNKALCLLGAFLISGSLNSCRRNVAAHQKAIEEEMTHLGRLELLKTMIGKWWND